MRGEVRLLLLGLVATVVLGQNHNNRDNARAQRDTQITVEMVKKWANSFGVEMWKSLGQATRRETIAKVNISLPAPILPKCLHPKSSHPLSTSSIVN